MLLAFVGCSHPDAPPQNNTTPHVNTDTLPAGVTAGEIGFRVNGQPVLRREHAKGSFVYAVRTKRYGPLPPNAYFLQIDMTLNGSQGPGLPHGMTIFIDYLTPTPAIYAIPGTDTIGAMIDLDYDSTQKGAQSGAVHILKFDTVNNLLSGTFWCVAKPFRGATSTDSILSGYFSDVPIGRGAFSQGTLSAVVNGTLFQSPDTGSVTAEGDVLAFDSTLQLKYDATDAAGTVRSLEVDIKNPGVGTYNFGASKAAAIGSYMEITSGASSGFSTYPVGSGTLTITAFDATAKRISGTFNFSGKDITTGRVFTITNGSIANMHYGIY